MEFSEICIFRKKSPCPCFILFTKIKQKERLVYSVYRKQVMPFEKFQKENFNQKWATLNMLRPLIFRNFFSKIFRKTKWAAPLIRPKLRFVHLPPKGKAIIIAIINRHPRARFKSELKNSNAGRASETNHKNANPGRASKASSTRKARIFILSYSARQKRARREVRAFPSGNVQIVRDPRKAEHDKVLRSL